GRRSIDEGGGRRARGVESPRADQRAQSLARARHHGAPAAGGVGTPPQAQLHDAAKDAAAELRAVLHPRGRGAGSVPALPRQRPARDVRAAGRADPHHAAREGQSVRRAGEAAMIMATPRKAAFAFIFVTVLLDMLALGMVIPVLPKLIESFLSGDTARASEFVGLFASVWALMQFLFSPVQGALSDRFGRRPVILVSNFGLGLDYVVMALAPNLAWLFVGRVISGICAASISTSFAYIADVTPPEQRSARFGMIGAAFGVGFVIGPAVGGLLGAL